MALKDKHIFIVEDNMHNRIVYQVLLRAHGAEVYFEKSGRESLYHLKQIARVDLIILDLMLPDGASGLDIFDEIRALPEYKDIPIVAISATDPAIGISQAKARGFSAFIAKPIDKYSFPKQLDAILTGESLWISL